MKPTVKNKIGTESNNRILNTMNFGTQQLNSKQEENAEKESVTF
jgi:hypothetical protein